MEVSPSARIKLVKSIVSLADACEGRPKELHYLYELCLALIEYAQDDDYSVAHDLSEYIQECMRIAEGNGDEKWRQELLETLQDDMTNDVL
jgi:hypothetical protein